LAADTPVLPGARSYFLSMERQVLEAEGAGGPHAMVTGYLAANRRRGPELEAAGGPHAMVTRYLVDTDGEVLKGASEDDLRDRLRAGTFFWLDLHRPEPSDLAPLP